MPNLSARLGLKKPVVTDAFLTDDIAFNMARIDLYPGIFIGPSASVPAWGAAHKGMIWMQDDKLLAYKWDGTAFSRLSGTGSIGSAQRSADLTENTGYYVTLVQKTGVVVPPGGRRIAATANWGNIVTNDSSGMSFKIERASTQLHEWPAHGTGGSMTVYETPTAGTYTYTLSVKVLGTSATLKGSSTAPIQLEIVEL